MPGLQISASNPQHIPLPLEGLRRLDFHLVEARSVILSVTALYRWTFSLPRPSRLAERDSARIGMRAGERC